ncbi:MAG: sugar phosphate isomerase/epimerase [Candidatus Helarchaeota archaeon]|nr:sugar phosphate isomerase/epimerase [Candidatus Helarchaeota archaeon]
MKFGIMPINFDVLDESFDLKNITLPFLVEKAINEGFEHIEVSMDLEYVMPGSVSRRVIKQLLKFKDERGISYSVHLPLWSIELTSPNALIREASINCIIESIKKTLPLDPMAYVLHLTGALAAEFSHVNLRDDIKNAVIDLLNMFASNSIEKILKNVELAPEKLALENIEFPFEATRKIVDKYNLSVCFDIAHTIVGFSGPETVHEFLNKHIDRIIEFHLNDGKFMEDGRPNDHLALGDGSFPMDIIGQIKKKRFQGPLVFELTFADAKRSLNLIYQQYPDLIKK